MRIASPRVVLVAILAVATLLPLERGQSGTAQEQLAPRQILALVDSSEVKPNSEFVPVRTSLIHVLAEMPLNYLGLRLHYHDVYTQPLPSDAEMSRYVGVLTWFQDDKMKDASAYLVWLRRQIESGKRVVVLGGIGAATDYATGGEVPLEEINQAFGAMGIRLGVHQPDNPLAVVVRRKVPEMVEFERTLDDEATTYEHYRSLGPDNRVYLTIGRLDLPDSDSDVVISGPWGGFVLGGYEYYYQDRTYQKRWRLNPFAFFEDAFGVRGYPRPDVSTLNGSRVFYTHIDGDGFNNVTEIDYTSLSSELLLNRFFRRYDLPFSLSIVVNDIDPQVAGGARQIRVAREIFSQPNIEPASHTYTHPFDWSKPVDVEREIAGALDFLNQHTVPPEKPVKLVLWSGATNPMEPAIARADELDLLNINGGDGRFDSAWSSLTAVAPLTTQVGNRIQYYTSNANDNIYGNDWTGPYYGMTNVIETFLRTESPRRIGALNVYIHIFTGEKHASVRALEQTYDWVLTRDIAPVFTTEYIRLVQGFISAEHARAGENAWRLRNYGALRTFRFDDEARFPDLARSQNVIGYWHYQGSLYVFLGEAPESLVVLAPTPPTQPYVALASHRVLDWRADASGVALALEGIGDKKVVIGNLTPSTEYEVVEQAGGERRLRLRSDERGTLTWSSDARGRVQLALPGATARR